jgi:hypothetical protein
MMFLKNNVKLEVMNAYKSFLPKEPNLFINIRKIVFRK